MYTRETMTDREDTAVTNSANNKSYKKELVYGPASAHRFVSDKPRRKKKKHKEAAREEWKARL